MKPLLIAADFSHYNGTIGWDQVARSGIVVTMLKSSQGAHTDPEIENWFADNADAAEAAGLRVIPYHYLNRSPIADQVKHFVDVAQIGRGDAVAWDWESSRADARDAPLGMSVDNFILLLEEATKRDALRYHGIAPPHGPPTALMLKKPWWLPRYGKRDNGLYWGDPGHPCLFHQYTERGVIPGVPGRCDRSAAYGTAEDILRWYDTGKLPTWPPDAE